MTLPDTMRAIEFHEPGGPDVMTLGRRPVPRPGVGDVVIRVAWAGVNGPDLWQRAGAYRAPAGVTDILGLEASGHIAAVGPGVSEWAVGDAVCALLPGGGYAEYARTPAAHVLRVPEGMELRTAAGAPETFFTVWSNVFERAGLQAGERILVHGGASGIGTTAIQLAAARGARVFTTASTPEKCAACLGLGAERAIAYNDEDFVEVLRAEGGANVILDLVGGDYLPRNLKALADDGRLVQIAVPAGAKVTMNLAQVMLRRLTITGSTLRPQSDLAKARIAQALRTEVWPLLDTGRIAPVIDSSFPLEEAAEAHARMASSSHIGKIVLEVAA